MEAIEKADPHGAERIRRHSERVTRATAEYVEAKHHKADEARRLRDERVEAAPNAGGAAHGGLLQRASLAPRLHSLPACPGRCWVLPLPVTCMPLRTGS